MPELTRVQISRFDRGSAWNRRQTQVALSVLIHWIVHRFFKSCHAHMSRTREVNLEIHQSGQIVLALIFEVQLSVGTFAIFPRQHQAC